MTLINMLVGLPMMMLCLLVVMVIYIRQLFRIGDAE